MNKETNELIKYRLLRARETLADAKLLMDNNSYFSAVNRLYYACFYTVISLLLIKDLSSKTHQGTKNLFFEHFVQTNVIEKDMGKFYSKIFLYRNKSNYEDFPEIDNNLTNSLYIHSKEFIKSIENYIKSLFHNK